MLLALVILILVTVYFLVTEKCFEEVAVILMITVIVLMIGFFVACGVLPKHDIITNTYELYSLGNYNTVSGRFFIGTGIIKGEMNACYNLKGEDGGLRHYCVPYNGNTTVIYEEDGRTVAVVEIHSQDYDWEIARVIWLLPATRQMTYVFRVPIGTVATGYHLQ
jgi:hypothetical protein